MNRDTIWGKAGRKAKREEFEDMTIEMQEALNRELEDAKAIMDADRIIGVSEYDAANG